jgi:thiol-disulfide isomerase/thioredoxin
MQASPSSAAALTATPTAVPGTGALRIDGARPVSRRALLHAAAATALCVSLPAGATPNEVPIGEPLRDAALRGLNGPSRRLAEFRGRPLIINVWASWCGPCVAEMASLERLAWHEELGAVAVIGISTDDYPERAQALLRRINATISHYIDHALELENMLGASSIPLTVLVDAQGRVVDKVRGAQRWDAPEALAAIRQRLKPAAARRRT